MRCDWQNDPNAPTPCHVINLDTGDVLSPCAMADEETGEYSIYVIAKNGKFVTSAKVEFGKARIKIQQGLPPLKVNLKPLMA